MRARNHRDGFTLIELLVVIAIIGILAAMLMPVLAAVFESANKGATQARIANLAQALKEYQADYGVFPPSDGAFSSAPLVVYLDGDTSNGGPRKPYMEFRADEIVGGRLVDPWGRVMHYRELASQNLPAPVKVLGPDGSPDPVASRWNIHGYDLWSDGPDTTTLSDDLRNF